MINVSNIEKFATHDGPGIRTTVFLKGCPLHCPWCANPETWAVSPVLMHNSGKCIHCQTCAKICPYQAISFVPSFHWDPALCHHCGQCVDHCLQSALTLNGQPMEIRDIVQEVLKDKDYYDMSHGGVTVSGGEPFVQFEGFLQLIQAFKKENLHVAVETTGSYPLELLKQAEPYIDLFLFDVKHTDAKKLKEVTGGNWEQIIINLSYLDPKKVISRTPVIPTFNDDPETLRSILELDARLGIQQANFLPYHSMGKTKWEQLHKTYLYDFPMMDPAQLTPYIELGKQYHVEVKIGG